MDLATIIGFVATFGMIIGAILVGGSLGDFLDVPSILITVGGTFTATFITYPFSEVGKLPKVIKHAFLYKGTEVSSIIREIVETAQLARKKGLLSIESNLKDDSHPLLRLGLQLVVDGHEAKDVDQILGTEMEGMKERHRQGADLFGTMGLISPAMGLIGTLIGLVQMLKNLSDPSSIGPAMAVALLTTFYGSLLANIIFNPIANKLKTRSQDEETVKSMIVTGVLAILSGDNPRIIEHKLNSFLPKVQHVDVFNAGAE